MISLVIILNTMYPPNIKTTVVIPTENLGLKGDLLIPHNAVGLVIFAHGSGSSRLSPRNQMVADYLNKRGIATFLFDLLTPAEDRDYSNRFNIAMLGERLKDVTVWLKQKEDCKGFRFGYFGASTGAAAAFIAASELPETAAVVSRGGRPDLAMNVLPEVKVPALLIVGGLDTEVLKLNQKALDHLEGEKKLEIIPGATHLFEEPGAMERVCVLAGNWFELHVQPLELIN
jgi:dienelactone hydrolase